MRLALSLPAIALAVATFSSGAQAASGWVPTRTLSHDIGNAVAGDAMRPGDTLHVAVALTLRDKAGLDALAADVMAGRTTRYLTPAQFLSRHAPTAAQAQAVVDHLRRSGFTHITVAPNRLLVSADGTVATAQAAFHVAMKHVRIDGRDAYANVSDAMVPSSLSGTVSAVLGLQNVDHPHTMFKLAGAANANAGAAAGSAVGHNPPEFSTIYDADALPPATNSTIAIISEGDITQTLDDLDTFTANVGFPTVNATKVVVGAPGTDTSGIVEWNMDSQTSISAAGGQAREMIFYVATTLDDAPLTEAYNQAVSDDTAQSINVSLGECENAAFSSGTMATDDAIFETAVAQGQVFTVSSGDSGSYTCGSKTGGQSYPAVSPYVMAVGGTKLLTTNQTTWAGETVWSCSGALGCELLGGEGGGVSTHEAAPSWQLSSGVLGSTTNRVIPDVTFDADPSSGALVLVGTKTEQVGGTSLAAPLLAGFWARLQSAAHNTGVYPAQAIYQYGPGHQAKMFHDITSGSNGGYSASAGFDFATGFGSMDVLKFGRFAKKHPGF